MPYNISKQNEKITITTLNYQRHYIFHKRLNKKPHPQQIPNTSPYNNNNPLKNYLSTTN